MPSSVDDAILEDADTDEVSLPSDVDYSDDDTLSLPDPMNSDLEDDFDDIAEFYSPPRVVPVAKEMGLKGDISYDIATGMDFALEQSRAQSLGDLRIRRITFLLLSPPCTAFTPLQRLWNYKSMSEEAMQKKLDAGMTFLEHSMECAKVQWGLGQKFVFEHPVGAMSWKEDCVQQVMNLPGVGCALFDMCCFGAKTKAEGTPVRKRARFLTNSKHVMNMFNGKLCRAGHVHRIIEGSEGGMKRARYSQIYPPQMCRALAMCAYQEARDKAVPEGSSAADLHP